MLNELSISNHYIKPFVGFLKFTRIENNREHVSDIEYCQK